MVTRDKIQQSGGCDRTVAKPQPSLETSETLYQKQTRDLYPENQQNTPITRKQVQNMVLENKRPSLRDGDVAQLALHKSGMLPYACGDSRWTVRSSNLSRATK